ncbi:MAG: AAA family ATPase [Clostridia bacterium]|nr:AAA family ATPase [Clostridia bacterium]
MFGNTDKPISSISGDTFGISSYVDGLCSFILNCDTPMTISIQGDWGSGKTSMMNMIKEKISESVCTIWFNTWQFSQFKMQDELSISLLYSLLSELDFDKEKAKKIFGFLSGAAKIATGIITEKIAGGYLAGEITDAMSGKDYDYAQEIKDLKSKFQEAINAKLSLENKDRVVIFVDDLDRLQPEKAVELLEVLKIFLDCENCVYVLAVDYEVVTQGIKKKFGDSVGEQKGKSFFDKIIQLPFKMPVAQYDISKYVGDMLIKMGVEANERDIDDYVALISLSVGCNPRSMKRLFNTYLLLDIILKSKLSKADRDSSNKILFAIICMQTEFETLYRYIVSNRDVLDREMVASLGDSINSNDEVISELGTEDEDELTRMSNFATKFTAILQGDNPELPDENIDRLKELLSFSTVTSVNVNESLEEKSDYDWKYRYINKDIAKRINDILKSKHSYDFRIWQPKKNNKWHRISDVWSVIDLRSSNGIDYIFDYSLTTDYSVGITSLNMSLYHGKNVSDEDFNNLFSENPLSFQWEKNNGNIQYKKIDRFSDIEGSKIAEKFAEIIYDALSKTETYVKAR